MPIEVHCPNPTCARVHQVKNRYAGARGKCPSCGSWMYVPATAGLPSGLGTRGVPLEQAPAALATGEAPAADSKPPRRFSRLSALFLLLGMAGLGAVCVAPQLPAPTIESSGDFAALIPNRVFPGFSEEMALYALYVPAAIAGVALLSLLLALIQRRFGLISVFLLYLLSLTCSALLLVALTSWQLDQKNLQRIERTATEGKAKGKQGELTASLGLQLHTAAGGAAVAALFFFLAAVTSHGRWWSRLLSFLVLGAPLALAPVWTFRAELGLEEWLPDPTNWFNDLLNHIRPWLGQ